MELPVSVEDLVRTVEGEVPDGALDRLHAAVALGDQVSALADGVVGHFVEAARNEGCSWAQIGAELGVSKQAAQQRFVTRPMAGLTGLLHGVQLPGRRSSGRRSSGRGFFNRFTAGAREAITRAQAEAQALGHDSVRTEHLVLSLLHDPTARPARALAGLGIDVEELLARVVESTGRGTSASDESRPFAAETKKALELALREGLQSPAKLVAPEHVLLGVLREGEGLGSRVLTGSGADLDIVRRALAEHA